MTSIVIEINNKEDLEIEFNNMLKSIESIRENLLKLDKNTEIVDSLKICDIELEIKREFSL